jgi:LEA14-like dessication related protein
VDQHGATLLPIKVMVMMVILLMILKLEKMIQSGIGLQVANSKSMKMPLGRLFHPHQELLMLLFLAKTNTTSLTIKAQSRSLQELICAKK